MNFSRDKSIIFFAALALILASVSIYKNRQNNDDKIYETKTLENEQNKTLNLVKTDTQKPTLINSEMTERNDFDSSVLVQERSYTEKEITEMSIEEFENLLIEVEAKLPKLSDIKKIPPEALHQTPAPVLQAGKELGLIKEVLKLHESYEEKAGVFYQACALNNQRPTPVRALCLTNLNEIKKKNGEKINKSMFSKEIIDLASMVTDF